MPVTSPVIGSMVTLAPAMLRFTFGARYWVYVGPELLVLTPSSVARTLALLPLYGSRTLLVADVDAPEGEAVARSDAVLVQAVARNSRASSGM